MHLKGVENLPQFHPKENVNNVMPIGCFRAFISEEENLVSEFKMANFGNYKVARDHTHITLSMLYGHPFSTKSIQQSHRFGFLFCRQNFLNPVWIEGRVDDATLFAKCAYVICV